MKNNEPQWADTERGSAQVAARRLAQQIPEEGWQRVSAGEGSKGPRLYDWSRLPIRPWSEPAQGHWLLVRSITDPNDLAYYACCGAEPVAALKMCRWRNWCAWRAPGGSSKLPSKRPNRRWGWTNTRCGGGSGGTGTSPSCRSTGQALALLVHAFLAVTRSYADGGDGKGGRCARENSSH